MKPAAAQLYAITHDRLMKKLCSGHLLHVDETSISVRGFSGYVWALTSMDEVAYFFTPTREGNTIQELLKNFSGVLVSDFYAAYDAIDCPQQKCLIHFIRDVNTAILEHPFDEGLRQFARNFAGMVMHRMPLRKVVTLASMIELTSIWRISFPGSGCLRNLSNKRSGVFWPPVHLNLAVSW